MKLSSNEFYFDSDFLGQGELCKRILCTVNTGESMRAATELSDCSFDSSDVELWDIENKKDIELSSLPESERQAILKKAESIFDDIISEDWTYRQIAKAERYGEGWER